MMWYIAIHDIRNFFRSQRTVFLWLVASMIASAVVMNYSYSFARYRGNVYEEQSGAGLPLYKISSSAISGNTLDQFLGELEKSELPRITQWNVMTDTQDGKRIAGATEISQEPWELTGMWTEGYASIGDWEQNACAISEHLLNNDGKLKMTGEEISLNDTPYVIRAVYEPLGQGADVVVSLNEYWKNYDSCEEVWIIFEEMPDEKEQQWLVETVKKYMEHGSLSCPDLSGGAGEMITASNQLQYSIFLVLLIVFLASVLQYWYDMNISSYTIYWMEGAKKRDIYAIVFCETIILCGGSYAVGWLCNMVICTFFTRNAALTRADVLQGFLIFFGTMFILCLINMVRLCRNFSLDYMERS